MKLDAAICYRAVRARDARYDGRFFTCVKSTGIYCRPVCPARTPKLENCHFVRTASAAQEAGFRPCLRCRPESSPDLDAWRGTSATVSRALKLIEGGALDEGDVEALAERLEIGERQLRRLFRKHVGAAPVTVAQTRRVLLAKQLLHQTNLSMIDVALGSGFGSVRRFNETFQQLYGRPPSALRRQTAGAEPAAEIRLQLPYRPPYDWSAMRYFLALQAVPGLESVTEQSYARVIQFGDATGTLSVAPAKGADALLVAVRFPELNALPSIIARVRRMFDLSADPGAIAETLSSDLQLAPLIKVRPGLRIPGAWDSFELAVRAAMGQQMSAGRVEELTQLVASLGDSIRSDQAHPELTHAFPRAEKLNAKALGRSGFPAAEAKKLSALASAAQRDPHLFDPRRDLSEAVEHLSRLPGIDEAAAHYLALRALGESDAFLPPTEARTMGLSPARLLERAEPWRPWRAYAALHLWAARQKLSLQTKSPKIS